MARLYANENFPRQVVEELRKLKHDVLTTFESGNAGKSVADEEVLAFAIGESRAVITLDRRDFVRLHQQNPVHFGIIVCTQDADTSGQAQRIDEQIQAHNSLAGQLLRVNRPGIVAAPGTRGRIRKVL